MNYSIFFACFLMGLETLFTLENFFTSEKCFYSFYSVSIVDLGCPSLREKCFQSEKCFHSNRSSENCFQTHEKTREKNEVIPVRIEQNPFLSFIWNFRFSTILDVLDFLSFEFRSKNKIEISWKTDDLRNYLGTLK